VRSIENLYIYIYIYIPSILALKKIRVVTVGIRAPGLDLED
jgi:hypothetical protein